LVTVLAAFGANSGTAFTAVFPAAVFDAVATAGEVARALRAAVLGAASEVFFVVVVAAARAVLPTAAFADSLRKLLDMRLPFVAFSGSVFVAWVSGNCRRGCYAAVQIR
jgi:hypothetical protein